MLILKRPWTRQPQTAVAIHPELREPRIVWTGSMAYAPQPRTGTPTIVAIGNPIAVGAQGLHLFSDTSSGNRVEFTTSAEKIFTDTSRCTIALLRRHRDTTARQDQMTIGYAPTSTSDNRVMLSAPWGASNILYWDFGSYTAGRAECAWGTKNTLWHTLVVTAGPSKGRGIWRNGVLIGSSAATGVCTPTGQRLVLGALTGIWYGDNEDVALCVVSNAEWTDSEIKAWSANPFGRSFAPQQIIIPTEVAASGAPDITSLSARLITATSAQPRISYS